MMMRRASLTPAQRPPAEETRQQKKAPSSAGSRGVLMENRCLNARKGSVTRLTMPISRAGRAEGS